MGNWVTIGVSGATSSVSFSGKVSFMVVLLSGTRVKTWTWWTKTPSPSPKVPEWNVLFDSKTFPSMTSFSDVELLLLVVGNPVKLNKLSKGNLGNCGKLSNSNSDGTGWSGSSNPGSKKLGSKLGKLGGLAKVRRLRRPRIAVKIKYISILNSE